MRSRHIDLARKLYHRLDMERTYTQDEFDAAVADILGHAIPERGLARRGHVGRRGHIRAAINIAAASQEMQEGAAQYRIVVEPRQMIRLVPLHKAAPLERERITRKTGSLCKTWGGSIDRILRNVNPLLLTPMERDLIDAERSFAGQLEERLLFEADGHFKRCKSLMARITKRHQTRGAAGPNAKRPE